MSGNCVSSEGRAKASCRKILRKGVSRRGVPQVCPENCDNYFLLTYESAFRSAGFILFLNRELLGNFAAQIGYVFFVECVELANITGHPPYGSSMISALAHPLLIVSIIIIHHHHHHHHHHQHHHHHHHPRLRLCACVCLCVCGEQVGFQVD